MKTISKESVYFEFNAGIPPVETAASGEEICFCCQDCYAEQITEDGIDFATLDMHRNNPVTGPLYIEGAEPGDVLRLEIRNISIEDHGVMCIREKGGIYDVAGYHCRRFHIREGKVVFDGGILLPVRPMIGVIGTAPSGEAVSTQSPGEHGGNLDIREIGEGSVVYLPVNVKGALLSIGDLHAVQGDGESAICGMEVSGSVTVRVQVVKGPAQIPTPFVVTDSSCYTTASATSLDECSVAAAQKMHRYLQQVGQITSAQAAMLLSMVGNLRISQVVNPQKGCMMEFPLSVLREISKEPWED